MDHVLPRAVIQHDEVWNLALAHSFCNLQKSDRIVGEHFIRKLVARNENIMGSNHPWKARISAALGATPTKRRQTTMEHYSNVCNILNWNYWGGNDNYSPNNDLFYSRLITVIKSRTGMNPFVDIPEDRILLSTKFFVVIEDQYPVSKGHCLIISKSQVETFFDYLRKNSRGLYHLFLESNH